MNKYELIFFPRELSDPTSEQLDSLVSQILQKKGCVMHYRNGREAKNGDKIIRLNERGQVEAFGILQDAVPGNDYCNGSIVSSNGEIWFQSYACLCDCLHIDDLASLLKENGLDVRPTGK